MYSFSTEAWIGILGAIGALILFAWLYFGDNMYKNKHYKPRHLKVNDKFMYTIEKVNGPLLYEVSYECRVKEVTDKGVLTTENEYVSFHQLENSNKFMIL